MEITQVASILRPVETELGNISRVLLNEGSVRPLTSVERVAVMERLKPQLDLVDMFVSPLKKIDPLGLGVESALMGAKWASTPLVRSEHISVPGAVDWTAERVAALQLTDQADALQHISQARKGLLRIFADIPTVMQDHIPSHLELTV